MFSRAKIPVACLPKKEKRSYNNSPLYYRCSLCMVTMHFVDRALPIDKRLAAAEARKAEGEEYYAKGSILHAVQAVTRALGTVRYFLPTESSWRVCFTDQTLVEVDVWNKCDTPERAERYRLLMVGCYLLLAQAQDQSPEGNKEAIFACDAAIELDPSNGTAHDLRARALNQEARVPARGK